ncbi:MAG: S8 family serine peptidase, partial [Betaproteobacteria bacterium]
MVQTDINFGVSFKGLHRFLWSLLGMGLTVSQAVHADPFPWYLEADGHDVAPASIQSASVVPGPASITVAVIDSGVIAEHPVLKFALLPGYDMVSAQRNLRRERSTNFAPDARDATCGQKIVSSSFRTHGTEVASIIAGNGYENAWGVNPQAKILPVRIFGTCGMSAEDMIDAIRWSAGFAVAGAPVNAHPAKVINISIAGGATQCRPELQKAIHAVLKAGVFVVAAAGNNFQRPLAEPANCEGVISVGALSAENKIENYSALDPRTSIYTAGGGPNLSVNHHWAKNKLRVATTEPNPNGGEHLIVADKGVGTSFAAPVVSGFLSLWLSYRPNALPQDWASYIDSFVRQVPRLDKCAD